jgi:hypothetical protein
MVRAGWLNVLLSDGLCTYPCKGDFHKPLCYHAFMKADLRISIKDYRRGKNLKILLLQVPARLVSAVEPGVKRGQ